MIEEFRDIDECVRALHPRVKRAAHLRRNVVAGMERADIESEMLATLVQVWRWALARPDVVEVTPVFWTAWNRRLMRLREQSRNRFMRSVYMGTPMDVDDAISTSMSVDDPVLGMAERLADLDPEASAVARMKAEGFTRDEVMEILGISRREYYRRWRQVIALCTGGNP